LILIIFYAVSSSAADANKHTRASKRASERERVRKKFKLNVVAVAAIAAYSLSVALSFSLSLSVCRLFVSVHMMGRHNLHSLQLFLLYLCLLIVLRVCVFFCGARMHFVFVLSTLSFCNVLFNLIFFNVQLA